MGYQEYIDKLLKVPREERHKLDRMEIFIPQSQLNDEGVYSCTMCGSNNVIKTEDISEKYEDDYLLECKSCKNWEEVGNNKPTSFKKRVN